MSSWSSPSKPTMCAVPPVFRLGTLPYVDASLSISEGRSSRLRTRTASLTFDYEVSTLELTYRSGSPGAAPANARGSHYRGESGDGSPWPVGRLGRSARWSSGRLPAAGADGVEAGVEQFGQVDGFAVAAVELVDLGAAAEPVGQDRCFGGGGSDLGGMTRSVHASLTF